MKNFNSFTGKAQLWDSSIAALRTLHTVSTCQQNSTAPHISDNNPVIFPVKTYSNADKEKLAVYEDNRKKCGVYR
jgi:hypothetical protein